MILHYVGILLIGIIVGFLGGLFGKGGSAIATPMLSLYGIPGFVAVVAPLPATVPGTFVASLAYWKSNLLDWQVVKWSIAIGVPATILGSYLTKYTGATPLLILTGVMVLIFGLNFLFLPEENNRQSAASEETKVIRPTYWRLRLISIAIFVGLISGLLANSGGFLLAPSYARILRMPIKKAFACSLAVSVFLALPGTAVHAYLGHIDWIITSILALGSVPFSYIGAKLAIKTKASYLEKWYGFALTALGAFFLLKL